MGQLSRTKEIWLWSLSVITVIALFGTVLTLVRQNEQRRDRDRDRLAFNIEVCMKSNELREQIIDLGEATPELFHNLAAQFTTPARLPLVNERLAPPLAEYQSIVDKIKLVDCKKLVPDT